MQLAELQQRYFRDTSAKEITTKLGFLPRFTKIFGKRDERRKSFLSDDHSCDQQEETKKTKGKSIIWMFNRMFRQTKEPFKRHY